MALVTLVPLNEMDGRRLYYTFIAGVRKVIEHQVELNKINVFPVNDGDTGTNLASTIRAVIDSTNPHRSYKITADRIPDSLKNLIYSKRKLGSDYVESILKINCEGRSLFVLYILLSYIYL